MLPSVGAGSAALTKYAQAAVTASEQSARDPQHPARTDQEAGAQQDERGATRAAGDTLARETRAAVSALLDLLRHRVQAALLEAGLPDDSATAAAQKAVATLAQTIADDSEHAARIVQAVLDRLESGEAVSDRALLHIAARGLTVSMDRISGSIEITGPHLRLDAVVPPASANPAGRSVHHLLDFTDGNEGKIAPVFAAFEAVRLAASETAERQPAGTAASSTAYAGHPVPAVAPGAFAEALLRRIEAHYPGAAAAPDAAAAVSRMVAAAISAGSPPAGPISVTAIVEAIAALQPAAAAGDADSTQGTPIRLASPALGIVVRPADGSVTVRIADRVVSFAPASLPAASHVPARPAVDVASLPIRDISPSMPAGKVLDEPMGIPFVPPDIDELPSRPGAPSDGGGRPAGNAATRQAIEDDAFRLLESAVFRDRTVIRSIEAAVSPDATAAVTRISLDLTALVGGAPTAAIPPDRPGRLGRSVPAPSQRDQGPVAPSGHDDAAATKPPVLPAWHALGSLAAPVSAPPEPAKPKRLPPRAYRRLTEDDAFTRDMPADYEGLVFSSVVFSV